MSGGSSSETPEVASWIGLGSQGAKVKSDNVTWPLLANARPCLQMQMLLLQTHGHRKRCPKQQLGQPGSVGSSYIGPSVGQTTGSWGCSKNILWAGNLRVLWATGLALLHAYCVLFFLGD